MNISRRKVLVQTSSVALATAIGVPAFVKSAHAAPLKIRKSANKMKNDDQFFQDYAEAIDILHKRPQPAKNLWRQQAIIHLNHCPHNDIGFFPWHRHYVGAFEKLCGEVLGKPEFTLAYWDWTLDKGRLHQQFFKDWPLDVRHWNDPSGASSPNWGSAVNTVGTRTKASQTDLHSQITGKNITASKVAEIMKFKSFMTFWKQLEGLPHNTVHVLTGGTSGHIGDGMSPLDPAFWLHHANIDRLWAEWQDAGNSTPKITENYKGQFVKADGSPLAGDFSADAARDLRKMGVRYDTQPEKSTSTPARVSSNTLRNSSKYKNLADLEDNILRNLGSKDTSTEVKLYKTSNIKLVAPDMLPALFTPRLFRPIELSAQTPTLGIEGGRILARLSDIKGAGDAKKLATKVFINHPNLSPEVPDEDPHYADAFSFFMPLGNHHSPDVLVDLTKPLRLQATDGKIDPNNIDLQLMAFPIDMAILPSASAAYSIGKVEIFRE